MAINADNYKLNLRSISGRWYTVNASDYDYEIEEDTKSEYYEEPKIVKRKLGLIDAIEADLFGEKDLCVLYDRTNFPPEFYTQKEVRDGTVFVVRDLGRGRRVYSFEIVYVKIILTSKTCARRLYIVANEAISDREFLSLVKFCQCERCLYYNKAEQLIRKIYRHFTNEGDDAPCLKEGTCDNELLKETRRAVHRYVPEYETDPIKKLSKRELKKWGKFIWENPGSPIPPSSPPHTATTCGKKDV